MKITYFQDTDTLYLEFNNNPIVETQEINENTLADLDQQGNICAITLEHAKSLTDLNAFSLETIVAPQLASSL
ncbi:MULTISPECIES: DUF2283 domain-containing protein [Microcystis]|jgi:uncharacterized protein YuzE|uniref:DUF2283 domain-containing protein n=2 Tax=Microcystis TaxID=1125 RepID=A0A0F6U298_MICAE|nr:MULTISPECIES: DUF2283 domain-containing protein [Microcystis]MCA2815476.1 DUF2283 domain-containing protein [Microcystis sp. M085S1]MCA2853530.1 DUF2283 domain-containing protein [Microcystis sp. M065S1]TRT77550.1 MAG: DUF2283 domain-containing protein [Microcystis flos-aquae Ma_QC_C_20070823_S18]TRU02969.1 MAG: DUF2283 domain-containing protein [Microcystis flos-aquae Ma_QC_C_20070823_S18D]TRV11605.1 MAG: DUF2283 domain-containing protein [Microcystis flos-aquae Mf_QC_C_20070823_S10D]TRV2